MRKFLEYGFGAIALYLAVAYGTNFGSDLTSAAAGSANVIKAFQGR